MKPGRPEDPPASTPPLFRDGATGPACAGEAPAPVGWQAALAALRPAGPEASARFLVLAVTLASGAVLFNFFGNATRGYIDTPSLLYWWGYQWFNPGSETEHGPLILGMAVWLCWWNLCRCPVLSRVPAEGGHRRGLALVGAGLLIHLAGYHVQQGRISILGLLVFAVGAGFLGGGRRWGRALIFPATLLLFAVPAKFLTDEIGWHLRMGVIGTASGIADALGFDVVRNGSNLTSGDGVFNYDVAPACSGIRSLMALASLSCIIGYLAFRGFLRRSLIFALAIPFAFVGNVLRILAIIVAGTWFGQSAGVLIHDNYSVVVFIVVLALTLGAVSLLSRFWPEAARGEMGPEPGGAPPAAAPVAFAWGRPWAVALGVAVASGLTAAATAAIDAVTSHYLCGIRLQEDSAEPAELPELLGVRWYGKAYPVTAAEREVLPPDTGFARRTYVSLLAPKHYVSLAIVLSGKDRSSIHKPETCLPGQGWTMDEGGTRVHRFPVEGYAGGEIPATVIPISNATTRADGSTTVTRALYAYYFVGGDCVLPTHRERMLRMAGDRLLEFKNHRWAYISALTVIPDGEAAGLARIGEVLARTVPHFQMVGMAASDP